MPRIFIGFHMVLLMVLTLYGAGCSHVQLANASKVEELEKRTETLESRVQHALEQQPEGNGAYTILVSGNNMSYEQEGDNNWFLEEINIAASLEHIPVSEVRLLLRGDGMLKNYILVTAVDDHSGSDCNLSYNLWDSLAFDVRTTAIGPLEQFEVSIHCIPNGDRETAMRNVLRDAFSRIREMTKIGVPPDPNPAPEVSEVADPQ